MLQPADEKQVKPDHNYMKTMDDVAKIIGFPLKTPVGRLTARDTKDVSNIGSMTESTEIIDMSLTRSPLKSIG